MKLVVPLTMPSTRVMRSPASDSRSGRMMGMAPATAASNSRSTPALAAASNSSAPQAAISSLLAVTTGFPASRAANTRSLAGSRPPMTSTTRSTSGSTTTDAASSVKESKPVRAFCRSRTATRVTSRRRPVRAAMVSPFSAMRATTAAPTLPYPNTPIRTVEFPSIPSTVQRSVWSIRGHRRTPIDQTVSCRGAAGRRESRPGRRRGPPRPARTPPAGGGPCCSSTPWSGRRRR